MKTTEEYLSLDEPPPETLRLFPLPDHVLMPGLPTPYRIFEPRYKQLVEDLLALPESDRWLAVPRLRHADESGTYAPGFHSIATAARMVHCSLLPKGDYLIVALGTERCRLEEIPSLHEYRLARCSRFEDAPVASEDEVRHGVETLIQLMAGLMPYLGEGAGNLPTLVKDRDDPDMLVFRLASISIIDPDKRIELLNTPRLVDRIELVRDALAGALALAMSKNPSANPFGRS